MPLNLDRLFIIVVANGYEVMLTSDFYKTNEHGPVKTRVFIEFGAMASWLQNNLKTPMDFEVEKEPTTDEIKGRCE